MGLRTWWLQNRLQSVDRKLRRLRTRQKHLREEAEDLATRRRKGLDAQAAAAEEAKLHHAREKVTKRVNDLVAEEERLKAELQTAERGGALA